MKIYLIDFETTGLQPYPFDLPLEIALYSLDLHTNFIKRELDEIILWKESDYQDEDELTVQEKIDNCWWSQKTNVKYADMQNSSTIDQIWKLLKTILKNQYLTSWNVVFDIHNYIWELENDQSLGLGDIGFRTWDCPLDISTLIQKIPRANNTYKWPSLRETLRYYGITPEVLSEINTHRAGFDAKMATIVLREMIMKGDYILPKEFGKLDHQYSLRN